METEQYFLKSELFDVEPGEDEETNPRLYGRQFAQWLRQKFIEKGYDVEEIIPEDWGWCVMCQRDPFWLWIACSSIVNYENTKPDDPIPDKKDIIWCCFATAEVPLFKRIFKKPNTDELLKKLDKELFEILKSENQITIISEDEAFA